MIKAVIFDLDGLLIDSEPAWKGADILLAKQHNFPLTDDFRKQMIGRGIRECSEIFIRSFNLQADVESLTNERLKFMYEILFKDLKLMPYAKELIEKLHKNGYLLAVATAGHQQSTAEKILGQLSVLRYFAKVVSGLDVPRSKPAPDIYIKTAKELKLKPNECLVFEDAVNGILAAHGAGMKAVGVNTSKTARDDLRKTKADFLFKSLNIPLKSIIGTTIYPLNSKAL